MMIQNKQASFKRRGSKGSWASGAGVSKPSSKRLHQNLKVSDSKALKNTHFRVGSWNVGSLKGRAGEVVETLQRRRVDVCCVSEVRFSGKGARMIEGKEGFYKLLWNNKMKVKDSEGSYGGVGILVADKWKEKIVEVVRVTDRIMYLKLMVGEELVTFVSIYAPQSGLSSKCKEEFYEDLQCVFSKLNPNDKVYACGDWNGHVGSKADGYEGVHGGEGFGKRNTEGERVLDFAVANNMVVNNTFFRKRQSHLITYESGPHSTQISYILSRKEHLKMVKDVKVIPGEECVTQHKLLVGNLNLRPAVAEERPFIPKRRVWKLKDPIVSADFEEEFTKYVDENVNTEECNPNNLWEGIKRALLLTTEKVCGWTRKTQWKKQTWWWNNAVSKAVKEKKLRWKEWKRGEGSKERYESAKRSAKHAVYLAKKMAEPRFTDAGRNGRNIFKIAKHMKGINRDVVGEKCVKNDDGKIAFDQEGLKNAWKSYHSRLLNHENEWNMDSLPKVYPTAGPPITVTAEMVLLAIKRMKIGKAAGPSGVMTEMLKASGLKGAQVIADLANAIIATGHIPTEWEESIIINLFKGKGDAMERSNYRGLKLLDHVMKVLERVLEKVIREQVDINAMQFGFMPGKGTSDAIFILRQMQEKYLNKNKKLYFAFVDLEKAFDRVPREVIWWSMRKLGVEEWLIKVVQSMYCNARSRVRVGGDFSEEFDVTVGVHQGSVLSPLLFIMVLEALSRSFRVGCPLELLYADDLAIIATSKEELLSRLGAWKKELEAKGLRVNLDKTKIMVSGPNLNTLKDSGKYPCAVCRSGVGSNSVWCPGCSLWVHKKCSGISGSLNVGDTFRCSRCLGTARPIDARPYRSVVLQDDPLEVVDSFCYLGDKTSAGGGCELSIINRTRVAWGKFHELLPLLTDKSISFATKGMLYATCVRTAMLHAHECMAPVAKDLGKLQRTDRSMIRWICGVKLKDRVNSSLLLRKLKIPDLLEQCRLNRLRWYGHVERSDGWIKKVTEMVVEGNARPGGGKKRWSKVVDEDMRLMGLTKAEAHDRTEWRAKIHSRINRNSSTQ